MTVQVVYCLLANVAIACATPCQHVVPLGLGNIGIFHVVCRYEIANCLEFTFLWYVDHERSWLSFNAIDWFLSEECALLWLKRMRLIKPYEGLLGRSIFVGWPYVAWFPLLLRWV